MSNIKEKFTKIFNRLKQVKHIEIYLALIVGLIVCGVYFIGFNNKKTSTNISSTKNDNNELNFSSSQEYVTYLENKLESVITNVKGISGANVVITLEKGFEYIYVTEEETSITSNGTKLTKINVVMVDGQPVVKEEIYPKIKGVVVVAKGVNDVNVKMNILSLIQTVIEVENSKINILES